MHFVPQNLILWSGGSALTLCIMPRTVHHCTCVSDTVARCGTCSGCHCRRVPADTRLTAYHMASAPLARTMDSHGYVRYPHLPCGSTAVSNHRDLV